MKKLKREEFDSIIDQVIVLGKNYTEAAEATGISTFTIRGVTQCFRFMRDGDMDGLRNMAENGTVLSRTIVQLTAEKLGKQVPEDVLKIIEARFAKIRARRNPPAKQEPVEEPAEAPAEEPKQEANPAPLPVNDAVYFIRILEELHQQNEYLKDLLDVVLPKYAADLKDNLNANSDVLGTDLRGCLEELKAIRCNTRKRGL